MKSVLRLLLVSLVMVAVNGCGSSCGDCLSGPSLPSPCDSCVSDCMSRMNETDSECRVHRCSEECPQAQPSL